MDHGSASWLDQGSVGISAVQRSRTVPGARGVEFGVSGVEREASANLADNVNETGSAENARWTDRMGAVSVSEGTSEASDSSNLSVLGRCPRLPTGKVSPKPLGGAQTDGPASPANLLQRRLLGSSAHTRAYAEPRRKLTGVVRSDMAFVRDGHIGQEKEKNFENGRQNVRATITRTK